LDLCLVKPTTIKYVSLSTKFHDGNHPEWVRILGKNQKNEWIEVLPLTSMQGHAWQKIKLEVESAIIEHVRIEMYPDGGLTRVGLFGDLAEGLAKEFIDIKSAKNIRFKEAIPKTLKPLSIPYKPDLQEIALNFKKVKRANLASLAFGAKMIKASNEHYGPAIQLLSPYPPINMFDGIESARSRKPDHFEEVIVELAKSGPIDEIVLDYSFFVNNNPRRISIDGLSTDGTWIPLVAETDVKAFAGTKQSIRLQTKGSISKLRLKTIPDGGINRLLVYGN
jgi:allantoicase